MILVSRKNLSNYWHAYFLVLVPLMMVLIFSYYPIVNGFIHIFYRWNGADIDEYVGLGNIVRLCSDWELLRSFLVVGVFIFSNLFKMIPAIITAVFLHHVINEKAQYVYRICFIIPMIVPAMVVMLLWKYFYEPNAGILNEALRGVGILGPIESFRWLSDKVLVIPALVFMGFPWVGAFSVLIYLAGLQNISKELYESAKLDGAGAIQIFWAIELPLITPQIRITLVLMIIHTIQGWQMVYLFLGSSGGPGGIASVPGLLIFREAFSKGYFGYGCAIGFLLFLITLGLTWLNNRFIRIEK